MKRHTIFIYTAALLTMLGTALPMSAQNKSFTVNRNDGASQKYSYSQGDRLVLNREDSQGKKHADFVEQQVYVGNAVHNIPLTSIESITFDTQATVDEGKSFTVQESGGKVEYDDITIDIPKGTFKGSSKVNISEVEKGLIGGENELSKFYKVKFYAGVAKNFNVSVKMPQVTNGDAVKMQFSVMGWAPSLNEECMVDNMFETSYAGGAYVAEIPAMESPEDADEIEVYFGVRKYNLLSNNSPARTRVPGSRIMPALEWPEDCLTSNYQQVDYYLSNWGLDKLGEAGSILENLGYEPVGEEPGPYAIRYRVAKGGGENPGKYVLNPYGKSFGIIILYTDAIEGLGTSGNYNSLMETVIHETFHWFQMYYDPRSAFRLFVGFNHFRGRTLLNEAASVWSETYYTAKGMPSMVTQEYVMYFLSSATSPTNVYVAGFLEDLSLSQNKGYGASALLAYLSKKFGIGIVYDIFKKRLTSSDLDPDDSLGIIEKVANENKLDIFSQKGYKEFVEALGTNEVYEGYNFTNMLGDLYKMREFWTVDGSSMVKGGIIKKTLSGDDPKVNFYNYVYECGALVESLDITANTIDEKFNGIENTTTIIEQKEKGLTTYVYGLENGNYCYIGSTKEGAPLELPNKIYFKKGSFLFSNGCVLVTILDEFKVVHEITSQSKIEARVEGKEVEFKVEPDHLDFEAGGGTQKLTVTTNQPKFKSEPDKKSKEDGWLKTSEVEGGVNVTTTPNTDPKKREGYVIVTPISAAGKALEDKAVTISVTQKPSFLLNVEPNPITLPGYGSEFKNGKMTKNFTVKYIKDAKSVNLRVEFEQDDKDKSWLTLDGDWATQTSDDMLFICKRNFTVTPNTSFTRSRSAKIIVELTMPDGSKPDPEIVPVTQEPMEGKLIIEAPDPLWLKAEEYAGAEFSDRQEVTINTNLLDEAIEKLVFKEEKLSSSKEWLKYEHKEKSKTIVIYADAYPEEKTPRDGIIYYSIVTTDGKEFPASVNVKQQGRGAGALFTINPSTIRFEAKASEMLVKVEGENVEGISSFDVQWPSWLGGAHSTLSKTLSLTATQNESKEERSKVFTLTVKMKNGDLVSRQFVAYQDGANDDEDPDAPYIAINSSLTFSNKGGSETVQYSTNQPDIAWETNCYWLTIEKTSDGLLVSAKPNLGNKDSSAKIIVYALDRHKNKVADVTINVKQQKGDGYKILVGKYYHERTKTVRDPEQGKYVETVEWYDELSITESSYTIKHVSNTNPSASYTKTGNLKISKLEVYRLTPAMDESTGIFNRDVSNWTDYDGYYMGGKFNIDGVDSGFTGSYIESSRYGHSYKLVYPIGGGDIHYKISNDPNDPILP